MCSAGSGIEAGSIIISIRYYKGKVRTSYSSGQGWGQKLNFFSSLKRREEILEILAQASISASRPDDI